MRYFALAIFTASIACFLGFGVLSEIHHDLEFAKHSIVASLMAIFSGLGYAVECENK